MLRRQILCTAKQCYTCIIVIDPYALLFPVVLHKVVGLGY